MESWDNSRSGSFPSSEAAFTYLISFLSEVLHWERRPFHPHRAPSSNTCRRKTKSESRTLQQVASPVLREPIRRNKSRPRHQAHLHPKDPISLTQNPTLRRPRCKDSSRSLPIPTNNPDMLRTSVRTPSPALGSLYLHVCRRRRQRRMRLR